MARTFQVGDKYVDLNETKYDQIDKWVWFEDGWHAGHLDGRIDPDRVHTASFHSLLENDRSYTWTFIPISKTFRQKFRNWLR